MGDSSTTQKRESEETNDQKRSMDADRVFIRLPKFHFSLIEGSVFTRVAELLKNIVSVDLKVTNYMSDIIDNLSGYIKDSKENYKSVKKNI